LWKVKRKPLPRANAPPFIPDSYPIPSMDDYVIDPDYPIDLSGEVRRTKTEAYL
jgi:hypothetical protein